MKKLYFIPLITLLFSFLNFSGCPGSNKTFTLKGSEWKLETLNGKTVTLKGGNFITLNFSGSAETISGTAVCNKYSGEFKKTDNALTFSGIGSTKMMCEDNLNESDYYGMLVSVDAYKISDGKLSLTSNGSVIAVFKQ